MATHTRTDSFTFDPEEINVLIGIVGGYSPALVNQMGLDVDAFERVYEALTGAAWAPMHEDGPHYDKSVERPHVLARDDEEAESDGQ